MAAKQSKNSRIGIKEVIKCKDCKNELKAGYEATMNYKPNGNRGFKVKFVRYCCQQGT